MERVTTLENVAVGDQFVVYGRYDRKPILVTCTKITPKRCVIDNSQYVKEDARGLGGTTWHSVATLYHATPEILSTIRMEEMRITVRDCDVNKISDSTIEQIYKLIKGAK